MKKLILPTISSIFFIYSCSNASGAENTTSVNDTLAAANTELKEQPQTNSTETDITEIFSGFPAMETLAKPNEYILVPGFKMMENFVSGKTSNLIFYHAKMATPGEKNSQVAFTFDGEQTVPNYMIIPIKAGEKAKKGDIVLTWWQSGSGMKRAIVTNDSDPSAPEVHYLDIDWENPAKKDGISIGQLKEKIKENTFVKITNEWAAGTTIASRDGVSIKKFTVVNISNNKVLAIGFAGGMKILNQSDCTPLKVNQSVKVGDKVQAPWVGTFHTGIVKEVKSEYGRAVIEFDHQPGQLHVIPFGDITTGLVL
jgi:hypothetical protein